MAFAAKSLADLPPTDLGELKCSLRSMSLPSPGPRSACGTFSSSASSCETPPPTRLYAHRVTTPDPVIFRGYSGVPPGVVNPHFCPDWDSEDLDACFSDASVLRLQL